MAAITKQFLSGDANGQGVAIGAVNTFVTLHTAVAGVSSIDEVWVWIKTQQANTILFRTNGVQEWSVANNPNTDSPTSGPLNPPYMVIPGWIFNNGTLIQVRVTVAIAQRIMVYGYVNRITP